MSSNTSAALHLQKVTPCFAFILTDLYKLVSSFYSWGSRTIPFVCITVDSISGSPQRAWVLNATFVTSSKVYPSYLLLSACLQKNTWFPQLFSVVHGYSDIASQDVQFRQGKNNINCFKLRLPGQLLSPNWMFIFNSQEIGHDISCMVTVQHKFYVHDNVSNRTWPNLERTMLIWKGTP